MQGVWAVSGSMGRAWGGLSRSLGGSEEHEGARDLDMPASHQAEKHWEASGRVWEALKGFWEALGGVGGLWDALGNSIICILRVCEARGSSIIRTYASGKPWEAQLLVSFVFVRP